MSLWEWLFNPSGLTPHGFCLLWAPGLIAMHVISDAVIGLAYFSIPLALAALMARRKDLEYGWVIYLFVAFILACGMTHLMGILTLWVPAYGIEGIIKAITALLSIATAAVLWPLIPKLVALPSPAQLQQLNLKLAATIAEQEHTAKLLRESEAQVRSSNVELERRVAERTAELTEALAQRDLLLREVYHRVKNNLQVVDSIANLQARQLSDTEAKNALQSLRKRLFALGLVHQQLMESGNLKTFDVAPFLQELSNNLIEGSAHAGVRVSVQATPLDVGLDFAIPLGLLVTELVTNSIKHAFPHGSGNINVVLNRSGDGTISLIVSDDGIGAASPAGSGMGLGGRIINGLVAQLKATMTVNRSRGTHSEISFAAGAA